MTILIIGGTGLVGKELTKLLEYEGNTVKILTRNKAIVDNKKFFYWDVDNKILDKSAFSNVDSLVNLAGEGIADKRWTESRKKSLISSRVNTIQFLDAVLKENNLKIKTLINASAIGYYGDTGDQLLTEENQPQGNGFMIECCKGWENSVHQTAQFDRKTLLRIGIVLSKNGGALPEVLRTFLFRLGIYFGNGEQYYSYIPIDDLCRMIVFCIENEKINGVYNAVSDHPVTNYTFTKIVGKVLGKFAIYISAPAFALRLILGEMSAVILNSNNVSNQKIKAAGFQFKHNTLEEALQHVLK
jgi:uncharacterized protein